MVEVHTTCFSTSNYLLVQNPLIVGSNSNCFILYTQYKKRNAKIVILHACNKAHFAKLLFISSSKLWNNTQWVRLVDPVHHVMNLGCMILGLRLPVYFTQCTHRTLWTRLSRVLQLFPSLQKPSLILVHTSCNCECDANLTSQLCFCCDIPRIRRRVEHNSTAANYLLRICDVHIRIAFAFAGSMNQALGYPITKETL